MSRQHLGNELVNTLHQAWAKGDDIQVKMHPSGTSSCRQYPTHRPCAKPLSALPTHQQHLLRQCLPAGSTVLGSTFQAVITCWQHSAGQHTACVQLLSDLGACPCSVLQLLQLSVGASGVQGLVVWSGCHAGVIAALHQRKACVNQGRHTSPGPLLSCRVAAPNTFAWLLHNA